jgi:hypothetical protein
MSLDSLIGPSGRAFAVVRSRVAQVGLCKWLARRRFCELYRTALARPTAAAPNAIAAEPPSASPGLRAVRAIMVGN